MKKHARTHCNSKPVERFIGLLLLALTISSAQAETLLNDGWSDGQPAFFQEGFVANEIGASRFTPSGPCPCFISEISLLYGGDNLTRTVRLHVWEDGDEMTVSPGPLIYNQDFEITGANDALQVFDVSAAGIFVNGPFRVGLEFFDPGLPSIARDGDGNIDATNNFILANGLGWVPSNVLGLTGDWIIRAEAEPQSPLATELKNDSWPPTLTAFFQGGFNAGEAAAVRLVPPGPCPCSVDLASVLIGGAPGFADVGLRIWADDALTDDPGSLLHTQELELDAAGATLNLIPLATENIVVNGPFRLGFVATNGGLPFVARDDDGITAAVNFIDDEMDGWVESGTKGLTGDWIMRAATTNQNMETSVLGYDNWNEFDLPAYQGGFVANEIAAVRLEPNIACPCRITGVRLLFGGTEGDGDIILRIWPDTGALAPAAELFSAPYTLTANGLAFRFIDLSGENIIANGPFRVGIEFVGSGPPSVARDHDGIVPGFNFIFNDSATWLDATTEAVPGDWIIRATIEPEVVLISGFE